MSRRALALTFALALTAAGALQARPADPRPVPADGTTFVSRLWHRLAAAVWPGRPAASKTPEKEGSIMDPDGRDGAVVSGSPGEAGSQLDPDG